jgi:hypothetical protein
MILPHGQGTVLKPRDLAWWSRKIAQGVGSMSKVWKSQLGKTSGIHEEKPRNVVWFWVRIRLKQ